MDAEILIKARKVFVEDNIVEYSETCPHCTSKGLNYKLRYFYLSLEEAIYKCENANCLYPFERFMFKSLIDNTVYYYEEVFDGGREAYLRVPLDGQNNYECPNPISTKLFCDSQRNPDIESYNCDFSDLLASFNTEPEMEPSIAESTVENPDFFEFLDETTPKTEDFNATKVLDENGIDSLINNILCESPMRDSPIKPPPEPAQTSLKLRSSTPKSETKLLKCIQHIGKVKNGKIQKSQEKSKQTFATAIRKARKTQSKSQSETSSIKIEADIESKPIPRPSAMASFFKSANVLRPTELAQKLKSLEMNKVNSQFLRQYMKAKENKLFAGEPSHTVTSGVGCETKKNTHEFLLPSQTCLPANNVELNILSTNDNSLNVPSDSSMRSADTVTSENIPKKARKPRARKPKIPINDMQVADIKTEKPDTILKTADSAVVKSESISDLKAPKGRRRAPNKSKAAQPTSVDAEKITLNQEVEVKTETKRNKRKQYSASVDSNDSKAKKDSGEEKAFPVKKSRKQKCDNKIKTEQMECEEPKPKPKRKQTPKSKVNTVKTEQPPLPLSPLSLNDDIDSEAKSVPVENGFIVMTEQKPSGSNNSPEGSTELVFPIKSVEEARKELWKNKEVDVPRVVAEDAPSKKRARKKPVEKIPKDVTSKGAKKDKISGNCSSSKRSKNDDAVLKLEKPKAKRTATSRKNTVKKTVTVDDGIVTFHIDTSNTNNTKTSGTIETDQASQASQQENTVLIEVTVDGSNVDMQELTRDDNNKWHALPDLSADDVETSGVSLLINNQKPKISQSKPYYQRKTFKKEKEQSFQVEKLIDEWDDGENEKSGNQNATNTDDLCQKTEECPDTDDAISVISIASESDKSFAFAGEPYSETNQF